MMYLSCFSVRYANTFLYHRATRTVQRSTGPRERQVGAAPPPAAQCCCLLPGPATLR
jgi:hypothetical protein